MWFTFCSFSYGWTAPRDRALTKSSTCLDGSCIAWTNFNESAEVTLIASVRPYLNIRNEAVSMVEQQASYILEFKKNSPRGERCSDLHGVQRRSQFSPIVGKLQRRLHKTVRAQLVLLWYVFPKLTEHQDLHIQVVDHSGERQERTEWNVIQARTAIIYRKHWVEVTYMFIFCLAFSISLLTSGVMLKRSFWGMPSGTMGERTISVFCL